MSADAKTEVAALIKNIKRRMITSPNREHSSNVVGIIRQLPDDIVAAAAEAMRIRLARFYEDRMT